MCFHPAPVKVPFLMLVGLVLVAPLSAAESFVAVLNNPVDAFDPSGRVVYGYARLTFSPESDRLCYSVSLARDWGSQLEITLLHGLDAREVESAVYDISEDRVASSGEGGCFGPLIPEQKADLFNQQVYLRLRSDAFPTGEIGGSLVRIRGSSTPEHEAWEGVAQLLRLDERQWELLMMLVDFSPSDWEQLANNLRASVADQSAPRIEAAGGPGGGGRALVLPLPQNQNLEISLQDVLDDLDDLETLVDEVVDFVTSLGGDDSRLSVLKGINLRRGVSPANIQLPRDANRALEEVDELVRKAKGAVDRIEGWVQDIQNSRLAAALEEVRPELLENIDDTVATFRFFKEAFAEKFDDFVGPSKCRAGSSCELFKIDLLNMVTGLKTLVNSAPALVGQEIDLAIEADFLGLFVEHTPPLALFLLKSLADELLPGWTGIIIQVQQHIDIWQGGAGASPLSFDPQGHGNPIEDLCLGLFQHERTVKIVQRLLKVLEGAFMILVEAACPKTFVMGATAEAGATVNPLPHPCRMILDSLKDLTVLVSWSISNFQQYCDSERQRAVSIYEPQLQACNPMVALVLPTRYGGHLERLRSLVALRNRQFENPQNHVTMYLDWFDSRNANNQVRQAFCCLCRAYGEIIDPSSIPSRPPTSCECR